MKMNNYNTQGLSPAAREKLPDILDSMGYQGRYKIFESVLSINSVKSVVAEAFREAEEAAAGEEGYLIHLRMVSYSQIWVPKSEASSLKKAYEIGLDHAENGYPIDRDPEFSVFCAADPSNGSFAPCEQCLERWQVEHMPDDSVDDDERDPREREYIVESDEENER